MKLLYALHDNCQTHQPSTLHYNIRSSIQDASFFAFNGRATSMAPIYGISLFIQVEFVGSGFANPCLFHGVNLLTFIYKSNKPASNIISTWTLQRKYQTAPIPPIPSPRLPSKFHNQTSTKGLPLCSSIYGETSRSECFCVRN